MSLNSMCSKLALGSVFASSFSVISFSFKRFFILSAQASAFWNSVKTPEISLKGFVYWFAYERKIVSSPTERLSDFTIARAPKIARPA